MLIDELLTYLFNGQSHLLATPMATWLASSRRFTAFVTTFRDKIRKKLLATQDRESLLDLRLELETAYLLLQERLLSLVYEPEQSGQVRCPDFAVTFTTSLTFMVEVTRLRADQKSTLAEAQEQTLATPAPNTILTIPLIGERLADTICSKLGQLLPQRSNVLLVGVEALHLTHSDLRTTMLHIQQRAERNDSTFLQRHRFRDRTDFFHHYQRLSEILLRGTPLQAGEPVVVWVNPQAKYPLPTKVRTVLSCSHTL
ncbi:MAG: hypothetical protein HY731_13885 [Candidatus Tectomicrobia bacterium]|nr:hypothetical protein [Candidatus Tectomicrobia bacterium]